MVGHGMWDAGLRASGGALARVYYVSWECFTANRVSRSMAGLLPYNAYMYILSAHRERTGGAMFRTSCI